MLRDYLNVDEFKIAGEVPLLLKLKFKHLWKTKPTKGRGVLVIDTAIVGDFLATLPALHAFLQTTDEPVDLLVSPPVKSIAEAITGVRNVYTARSIYNRRIEKQEHPTVLPEEYGSVLVLRISPEAYSLLKQVSYRRLTTYEIPFIRYFVHLTWNISRKQAVHQWRDVNYEMARVAMPDDIPSFDEIFSISDAEYQRIRKFPELQGTRRRIIIHTGSGWSVKLWDNDKWIKTIRDINRLGEFDFIFIGGGDVEAQSFEYIQQRVDFKLESLVNKVDLRTSLLVMRLSDYFIGIDSGPRNMAHLADLRSITLLGPAPKNFMPVSKMDVVIDRFTCRCKSLFYLHKVSAIQSITSDDVLDGFKKLLAAVSMDSGTQTSPGMM